jgi:ATP-dependent Clp protease ATP-binding subunit ClpA
MHDPLGITDKDRLMELLAQRKRGEARVIDEQEMRSALKQRVRGQDHVIDDLSSYIRLQWGKEQRKRPIANLLFVGPPATGKTELAKAMAEFLFESEKNMLRFDCSEFTGPEGKTRLIGTPTGYVGATQGGALTRPMFSNRKRLILFDEIEKAFAGVFDLFLSVMGDGRLTEQGSGKVADFTQAILVLTSNAQHDQIGAIEKQIEDPSELSDAVKSILRDSQTFRPEIISRFDRVYVFRPLEGIVNAEIAAIKIASAAKEYGLEITYIDPQIVLDIMERADVAKDTRELGRMVDTLLGDGLIKARGAGHVKVKVWHSATGPIIEPES